MHMSDARPNYYRLILPVTLLLVFSYFATNVDISKAFTGDGNVAFDDGITGEATKKTGGLIADSRPQGATIYVDNIFQGTTPSTVDGISTGYHEVKLTLAGYKDYKVAVSIRAGKYFKVNGTLMPLQTNGTGNQTNTTNTTSAATSASESSASRNSGSLRVLSTPSGADVYIDSSLKGATPITVRGLSAGSHSVLLKKTGYKDYNKNITIRAGKIITLNVTLVPVGNATKPDLLLAGFFHNQTGPSSVTLNALISNGGNANAGGFWVLFAEQTDYGYPRIGEQFVSSLNAGQSVWVSQVWEGVNVTKGVHKIYVVADSRLQIPETDETNNKNIFNITIV